MYKIVHIARPVAGVGVYINLLAKYLDNKKFQNILICNEQENIVEIKDKLKKSIPQYHVNLVREINLYNDSKCLNSIIGLLREIKPDIIHCHSAKAGFLGRLAGVYLKIPTLYTPHAFSYLSAENNIKKRAFKFIEKIFCLLPSKLLACSPSEYNRALTELKFKKEKLYLWNNSIEEIITLKPSKLLDELPDKFICSIGRPSYQKNIEMLLDAMSILIKREKNIQLVLLGAVLNTLSTHKIKTLIKEKGLTHNITLIPWLKREETLSILKASAIYVSTSKYEGLPYSVIEALSLKKPCVVTNVDGNKDLITNNYNGFLIPLNNSSEMADKINIIFNDEELQKQFSKKSKEEYLKKYNIKYTIKELEKIYLSEI